MRIFEYLQPENVDQAIGMLKEHGSEGKLIAGGTDLLLQMERKGLEVPYLIGLHRLSALSFIRDDPASKTLRIGALTSIQEIADSPLVRGRFPFLAEACSRLGSVQVRNIATLGGNLCNAAPSAEAAPPLLCLGAWVTAQGIAGKRTISLDDFFLGPGQTALRPDEVLLEIEVPNAGGEARGTYQRLAHRRGVDIAVVSAAVLMKRTGEACELMRIVLGAVAPVPLRARKAEALASRQKLSDALIGKIAQTASEEASPITDVRGSAEYRRDMVRVLVAKGIREIL